MFWEVVEGPDEDGMGWESMCDVIEVVIFEREIKGSVSMGLSFSLSSSSKIERRGGSREESKIPDITGEYDC
jgi:hypothetical protein